MGIKENTEAGSEVGISKCISLRVNYIYVHAMVATAPAYQIDAPCNERRFQSRMRQQLSDV